jgi:hypothetical protein
MLLIILLLLCILAAWYSTEPFENTTTVVVLGDSILNNSNYVSYEETVQYHLSLQPGINLIFRAKDNSHIADLEAQATVSPEGAIMIISSGGNDLINQHNFPNLPALHESFDTYMHIIHRILDRYKPKKVYMLNLYLPPSMSMKPLHPYIKIWNSKLREFAETHSRLDLIEIDKDCMVEEDFTELYEPSGMCSRKIARKIHDVLTLPV